MFRYFFIVTTLFITASFTTESFAKEPSAVDNTAAARQFLVNLGFEDVPSVIRSKIEKSEFESELNRRQMIANMKSYEVLNASRELALLMMQETMTKTYNSFDQNDQMIKFAAKMLALKPLSPVTDYPTEILEMPAGEEKNLALTYYCFGGVGVDGTPCVLT